MQHHGGQRNIAADGDVVAIRYLFCGNDVHVFVDRDGIRRGFAHYLDVPRCVTADEERGECALVADMREDFRKRLMQKLTEVIHGDLRNQRINHGYNIHPRLDIIAAHALAALGAVGEQFLDIILVVIHIHEDVVAAQMARQRERPADESVERGGFANRGLHAAHGGEHHRQPAIGFIRQGAIARHGHGGFQRMRLDGRRAVIRPEQFATEHLGLQLQIEHNRLPVGLIEFVHLQQRIHEGILICEHLGRVCANEFTRVYAGKGNPGRARRFLMTECGKQYIFRLIHNSAPYNLLSPLYPPRRGK